MRIITIDDRRSIVNIILRTLEKIDPDGDHLGFIHVDEMIEAVREKKPDAVFMDVEMPEMNGIELAKALQEIDPRINIIFTTGYKEYMPEAFDLYASGYLLKPIEEEEVRKALSHLRYGKSEEKKRIFVQCFGTFEVFVDNKPMNFRRSKSKELFAYLVDRKGASCTNDMIIGNLWGDRPLSDSLKSLERTVVAEMIRDLENKDVKDVIIKNKNGICINKEMIDCDYYRYLEDIDNAGRLFKGEYMTQYEFAQETRDNLLRNNW